jgi:hypothetical protein
MVRSVNEAGVTSSHKAEDRASEILSQPSIKAVLSPDTKGPALGSAHGKRLPGITAEKTKRPNPLYITLLVIDQRQGIGPLPRFEISPFSSGRQVKPVPNRGKALTRILRP